MAEDQAITEEQLRIMKIQAARQEQINANTTGAPFLAGVETAQKSGPAVNSQVSLKANQVGTEVKTTMTSSGRVRPVNSR